MRKAAAAAMLTAGLVIAPAIGSVHAQETEATEDDDGDKTGLWGLAGLLGLAGLAGLKRRNDHTTTVRRDTTPGATGVR